MLVEVVCMAYVKAFPGEDIDALIERFSAQVKKEGILSEFKDRMYFSKRTKKKKVYKSNKI